MNDINRRVIIIDDHPLFRKGAGDLVMMEGSFEFAGEAASGLEGIELAKRVNPDLILLDLNMKGMDGLETLKTLRKSGCEARIIMLTVSNEETDVVSALRAGADGYLLKDMEPEDIIKEALAGQASLQMALGTSPQTPLPRWQLCLLICHFGFQHGIYDGDNFTCDCDQGDLGGFSCFSQSAIFFRQFGF